MTPSTHCDWWVLGCEPVEGNLLVKCHLTRRTGVIKNASPDELLMADAHNFTSFPWLEPDRVTETPFKPHAVELAKKSQNLSTFMRKTQSLASRRTE
jgi:hypothetical protein